MRLGAQAVEAEEDPLVEVDQREDARKLVLALAVAQAGVDDGAADDPHDEHGRQSARAGSVRRARTSPGRAPRTPGTPRAPAPQRPGAPGPAPRPPVDMNNCGKKTQQH